ncbi:hypothetical protein LZ31DRAFT_555047 [Colletotrichum somersetense]|nr:hypothetical protein LZ31DRAFT_555047 [Colletotrichum somersetense]
MDLVYVDHDSALDCGSTFGLERIKDDCVLLVQTTKVDTPDPRTDVASSGSRRVPWWQP